MGMVKQAVGGPLNRQPRKKEDAQTTPGFVHLPSFEAARSSGLPKAVRSDNQRH